MKKSYLLASVLSIAILAGPAASGAHGRLANANSPGLRVQSMRQVLRLRPSEVDLATAALIISERWSDIVYGRRCLDELDDMASEIQARLREAKLRPNFRAIPIINNYLFRELGFRAVSEVDDPNDLFLHTVLDKRRGYCLSLSVLYLSIGERLGMPVHGVVVPGHFFVRYDDGRSRINVETVAGGSTPSDDYYIEKYNVPPGRRDGIYMKNLDKIQTLGCFFNNLGIVYSDVGNNDYALETLLLAVELNPVLSESRSSLGNAYLRAGRIADAIYQYEKALEINPNEAKTHNNLGNAYTERGWTNYAISEYLAAIELDPELPDARKNLARAYSSQKRYRQALSLLKEVVSRHPDDADCFGQMGNIYQRMGDCDRAVAQYQKAVDLNPAMVQAHCGLAQCYNELGMQKEEIEAYRTALSYQPDVLMALVNLGNVYFQEKQYDDALELYKKAAGVQPDDASIRYNIGAAYFNQGLYEEATDAYREAVALNPKLADAHYGLAVGLYNLGQYRQAWEHINAAKRLGANVTEEQLEAIKSKAR